MFTLTSRFGKLREAEFLVIGHNEITVTCDLAQGEKQATSEEASEEELVYSSARR